MNGNNTVEPEFNNLTIDELKEKLQTSEKGLSSDEATKRLSQYGPNSLNEHKQHPIVKFLKSFWGPIPWMIEIAAILSAVIHHWEDFWIISTLLVLNAVVGFWQEHKADNAIELLKKKLALKSRVLRDGKWQELPAGQLVPGDVIRLRLGDVVPADAKLTKGDYLQLDESSLTGESLPVEKKSSDMAYSGAVVKQGEMNGIVTATGMNTFFGKTAKLVQEAKTTSHFQRAVIKIGNYLIVFAFVLVSLIFIVSLFRGESMLHFIQFALVLMVAAIPAAMPAVLSVTMAVGASALARKEAIVSRLASIEEMAGMDILCSDKTGTITKNELTLAEVVPFDKFTANDVLVLATLASSEEDHDPIDSAIIEHTLADEANKNSLNALEVTDFKPFDPVIKHTESTVKEGSSTFQVAKGAPQAILSLIKHPEKVEEQVNNQVEAFAEKGYRALGVARTDKRGNWTYVGMIPLYDPPREDSAETIKTAQEMGVEVKMITGDHTAIAKETASMVGLKTNIKGVDAIMQKSDRVALKEIEESNGFAQVFPEHKYHIVEILQNNDHIVGMTGDGVNDAPALKKADVGIAVAGATDAAKSAASIVLTKPGLSVIIDAIKESRKIFQRMNNYSIYRIAETIRVLLFITLSIIAFNFYPVSALMIVLLALLNDAPIMTIAVDNVKYSRTPDKWNMRTTLGIATFLGLIGVLFTFGMLFIGKEMLHLSNAVLQPFIYLKLSVAGQLTVFMARTKGHFWSVKPSKALLLAIISTQIVATLITVNGFLMPAMGWKLAALIWGYALLELIITDALKVQMLKVLDHSNVRFRNYKHWGRQSR